MAYTTINKSTDHFNTKLYTGTHSSSGAQSITGVGFQPDWCWLKNRSSNGYDNRTYDSVRTATKLLNTNLTNVEGTDAQGLTAFGTDGFTVGTSNGDNNNGDNYVSWNWLAGGTAPSQTYVVKVVSDSGNKYRFDDFGTSAVTLDLQEGGTYTFDQSDSSNSGHPLRFYTAADKTGGEYTTGVTTNGTPGSSGAYTRITVAASAPTLYYQCSSHAGMGGQANTNSSFGSSNFSGSIQSTVSANTTAGFSIVKWTATSNTTFGHGLGQKPAMIICKSRSNATTPWLVWHQNLTGGDEEDRYIILNSTDAQSTYSNYWGTGGFTNQVFGVNANNLNNNIGDMIGYVFAEKTGYSKFGSYTGNGNADGSFIYTGFKPAFVIIKRTDTTNNWHMVDNKRDTFNPTDLQLYPNLNNSEYAETDGMDFLSNGFKVRENSTWINASGGTYIYMAFGQSLVGSNNIPATAR